MKRGKKLLSLALALTMALSLLPVTALAAEAGDQGVLTYKEAIRPRYDAAQPFSEGLAAVKRNGKWGYIDEKNKTVIPFDYDQAYEFSEGLAVVGRLVKTDVRENEVWDPEKLEYVKDGATTERYTYEMGFINKSGKAVWLVEYVQDSRNHIVQLTADSQEITDSGKYVFHNGYLVMTSDREVCLFDTAGKRVDITQTLYPYPVNEGLAATYQGYCDLNTGRLFDAYPPSQEWEISNRLPFHQGLAPVWVRAKDSGALRLGFLNTSGQWVIQPFPAGTCWVSGGGTSFRAFGETGLCMVSDSQKRFGAIDKTGQTVIPFQYENLLPASEGRIAFQSGGKWGFLNAETLETDITARYAEVTSFHNGLAVAFDGTKAFLIDWDGEPVPGADKLDPAVYFRPTWDGKLGCYAPDEYVVIQEEGKYGYGHIEYTPALPEKSEMSGWAYEGTAAAIQAGLIPVSLQNLYRSDITREEFCSAILQAMTEMLDLDREALVQKRTRKSLSDWQRTYPFSDTADLDVIAAYALGIVSGRDNGRFDPCAPISRQEAACFLARSAKVLRLRTPSAEEEEPAFADGEEIEDWAMESVSLVSRMGVMSGTGDNRFTPQGSYSREQTFVTIYRLYQAMQEQK